MALSKTIETILNEPLNIHGVIIVRHGHLIAEYYQGGKDKSVYGLLSAPHRFDASEKHDVRSISKSVTSLLAGIAQQQGAIPELSTPVLSLYPPLADLATTEKKNIRLLDLLNMSNGLDWHEGSGFLTDELRLYWKYNTARFVLNHDIAMQPGTGFHYNGGGTAIMADLITRGTHLSLSDYANKYLFSPLAITDWEWRADIYGRPMAFNGLRLRPRDLAKIGQLVLDHGRWEGRQIVPKAWIDMTMTPQFSTGVSNFRYGYQWWAGTVDWHGRQLPWHAGFGNGGQRLFMVPELDLILVTTAGAYDEMSTAKCVNQLLQQVVATVLR